MSRLQWNKTGDKKYTVGIHEVVLFPMDSTTSTGYANGVAWEGVSKVGEAPEGAEATDIYALDTKYGTLRSAENFGGTIEAYSSPEEFDSCDGCATIAPGVVVRQQNRKPFGLAYKETIGNDTEGTECGEILHLVYNATASPSSVDHDTVNESPDVNPLSWEFKTTPVNVPGYKPASHFEFRSDEMSPADWKAIDDLVCGSDSNEATLPLPETIISMFGTSYTYTALTTEPDDWATAYYTKYYTKYGTDYTLIPRQDSAPTFVANQYYSRSTST
ncbi:MAG: hypothetical protein J6U54_03370 [Clostridiales bacterium]|nr:hypothetical protein [Clostridiales bacterium]